MDTDKAEMLRDLEKMLADEEFCQGMREIFASDEVKAIVKVGAICLTGAFIIECMTTARHI